MMYDRERISQRTDKLKDDPILDVLSGDKGYDYHCANRMLWRI